MRELEFPPIAPAGRSLRGGHDGRPDCAESSSGQSPCQNWNRQLTASRCCTRSRQSHDIAQIGSAAATPVTGFAHLVLKLNVMLCQGDALESDPECLLPNLRSTSG